MGRTESNMASKAIAGAIGGMFGHSSDIHEAIRQLFDLSPEYTLITDLDCQLSKKGKLTLIPGHLYVFNKCLGFHSPKMKSLTLHYNQIDKISKNEKLKLIKNKHNIKVTMSNGTKHSFKKLKNRDETISIIQKLWQEQKDGTLLGTSDLGSTISPSNQPESTITLDSALKTGEQESDESGDEDNKAATVVNEDEAEGGLTPGEDPFYEGEDDWNLRDPTDQELLQALA
jgi:hypothetical protein